MSFRYKVREQEYLPNLNLPDTRPANAILPKKDWGNADQGAVLVEIGGRAYMIVTVEELVKHVAVRGGKVKEG